MLQMWHMLSGTIPQWNSKNVLISECPVRMRSWIISLKSTASLLCVWKFWDAHELYHKGEAVQKLRPVWTLSLERHTRMMMPSHSQLAWHSSPCPLQFYHVLLKLYWPTGRAYRAKRGPPQNQESTRPKITEVPKSLRPVNGSCAISEGARRTLMSSVPNFYSVFLGPKPPSLLCTFL